MPFSMKKFGTEKKRQMNRQITQVKNRVDNKVRHGLSHEADCAAGLKKFALTHNKFYWRRINDVRDYRKRKCPHCNKKIEKGSRLQSFPTQIADFECLYLGKIYFFEAKSTMNPVSWSMRYLTEDQLAELLKVYETGSAVCKVILANRHKRGNYRCFAIDIPWLAVRYINAIEKKRKWSLRWTELEEEAKTTADVIELTRDTKNGCWNFDAVFR